MKEWLRKIPHPQCPPCGGASNCCSDIEEPDPSWDWMQVAFWRHDRALKIAKDTAERTQADKDLAKSLNEGDINDLSNWYSKIYCILASKFIFKV